MYADIYSDLANGKQYKPITRKSKKVDLLLETVEEQIKSKH